MLPDLLPALDAATDQFRRHLSLVGDDAWTAATPCTDWDVQYLVAHVVGATDSRRSFWPVGRRMKR